MSFIVIVTTIRVWSQCMQKDGSDHKLARNLACEPGFLVQFDSGAHKLAHNPACEPGKMVVLTN